MLILVGIVALLIGGFLAFRIDGRLWPRPMAVRIERFFLANPVRRRFFGPDRVLAAIGDIAGRSVLEVGVGAGVVAEALAGAIGPAGEILGLDVQSAAVEMTRDRLRRVSCRHEIRHGDAQRLPFEAERVDRVVMVAMLGEVPAPGRTQALREAGRVLRPDGRLVVTEFWPDPHYISHACLVTLLKGAGFAQEAYVPGLLGYSVRAKKPLAL